MTRSPRIDSTVALAVAILVIAAASSVDLLATTGTSHAGVSVAVGSGNGQFVDHAVGPFGTFGGVDFVRHSGRFVGTTSDGAFRVPFEIVAPTDPGQGSGSVLVEAPHWAFAPIGRDLILGRELIFGRGISYGSVGYGTDGGEILDASATDAVIAGEPVMNPGALTFAGRFDEEILIQFAAALGSEPLALQILGPVLRIYAYGQSRSADAMVVMLDRLSETTGSDLFDLTFIHAPSWRIEFPYPPGLFEDGRQFEEPFTPFEDVGRVVFLQAEGDLMAFAAEEFEQAANRPEYRVYQVTGAAHLPTATNPLDHWAVMRAIFVAGDEWVTSGVSPPPSTLVDAAPGGQIDPLYGVETGIARDEDLNALGGVRLPDLEAGRALFVASDPATSTLGIPFLGPLTGSLVELACKPAPGSSSADPRLASHGDYVSRIVEQANALRKAGFLLDEDIEALIERAAESGVGKPGTCL